MIEDLVNPEVEKVRPIINKALRFHVNRLASLREHEDFRNNNDILKQDLLLEATKINRIITDFNNREICYEAISRNKESVCSALLSYVNHLESSKRTVLQKLGEGVTLDFTGTNNEISLAKHTKEYVCNNPDW